MKLNKAIIVMGKQADYLHINKDLGGINKLIKEMESLYNNSKTNLINKLALAYYIAVSNDDLFRLRQKGIDFSIEKNNENQVEKSLLYYRESIRLYNQITDNNKPKISKNTKKHLFALYLMSNTNLANSLSKLGRFISALYYYEVGVVQSFGMAIGNKAICLLSYSSYLFSQEESTHFNHQAYDYLMSIKERKSIPADAKNNFNSKINELETFYTKEYLETPIDYDKYELGDTDNEKKYREWAVNNGLFINHLNDLMKISLVSEDGLHLPNMIVDIDTGTHFHGLINQIKQEYASARFMTYNSINSSDVHYSDKLTHLLNTFDYPIYSLNAEQLKTSFRILFSIFDKIAFFLNAYFQLDIKERDVSFKKIWLCKFKDGQFKQEIFKEFMSMKKRYNGPLNGLYWISKEIKGSKEFMSHLDPISKEMDVIRNHLEHKYLKLVEFEIKREKGFTDELAYTVTYSKFYDYTLSLLKLSREAIMYLLLTVNIEELHRKGERGESFAPSISFGSYEDEWKV